MRVLKRTQVSFLTPALLCFPGVALQLEKEGPQSAVGGWRHKSQDRRREIILILCHNLSLSHWIFVLGRKLSRVQDFLLACGSFPVFPLFKRFPESIFPCVSRVISCKSNFAQVNQWITLKHGMIFPFQLFPNLMICNLQDNTFGERERNSSICRALEKKLTSSKAAGHGYCPGHANECECFALEAKGTVESPLSSKFHDLWLDMPLAYLIQPLDGKQIFVSLVFKDGVEVRKTSLTSSKILIWLGIHNTYGDQPSTTIRLDTRGLGEDCNATSGMLGPQGPPSRLWWSWRHRNKPSLVPGLTCFSWARILWRIFRIRKKDAKGDLCGVMVSGNGSSAQLCGCNTVYRERGLKKVCPSKTNMVMQIGTRMQGFYKTDSHVWIHTVVGPHSPGRVAAFAA